LGHRVYYAVHGAAVLDPRVFLVQPKKDLHPKLEKNDR
jgi:hypothetical protein